jgi:insulysin
VYSNRDLDEMEVVIRDLFSHIVNKNVVVPSFVEPAPYSEEHLGNFYRVKSVIDENELNITFMYPCYEKDVYYEVMQYPCHVLGHEGENSLLSALIKKNLATSIEINYDNFLHAFTYIDILIDLTDNGFNNYEEVIEIVWARINQLKESGPQEYIFKEYSANCRLSWQFYEKNDAYTFVTSIAERMQNFNISNMCDILSTQYIYKGFNKEGIDKVLEGLNIK